MNRLLLLCFTALPLFGAEEQTLHSSLQGYYEHRIYTNSKQKTDGKIYGIGGDIHYNKNEFRFNYEDGGAHTKKPPLNRDLQNKKIFLRYGYSPNKEWQFHINYLSVLDDNIAITSGGDGYGAGISYGPNRQFSFNATQYMVTYHDFRSYQSDIKLEYKTHMKELKVKFSILGKYIKLNQRHPNSFTRNARNHYFTSGIKLHAHYKSYHCGAGAYFGKRVFAVMNDGFKLQHHAMEFNRTYAVGVGKTFDKFVFRVQYIYNKASELPLNNTNVTIKNYRFILNYKL